MSRALAASEYESVESIVGGKHRIWSVAAEVSLLVFCFAFAIYTSQSEPRRRSAPHPASPAQQTHSPQDNVAPLTEPIPPTINSGEAVAII